MATCDYTAYDWTEGTNSTTGNEIIWKKWNTESYLTKTTGTALDYAIGTEIATINTKIWYKWATDSNPVESTATYTYGIRLENKTIWKTWNEELDDTLQIAIDNTEPSGIRVIDPIREPQLEFTPQDYERMMRKQQSAYDKIKAEKEEAEKTAKRLLFELVGKDQRAAYERTGNLFVRGKKHDYIIKGYGHIRQIDRAGNIQELCVHIKEASQYPDSDNVISLLMALTYDEEQTVKTANKHQRYHYDTCGEFARSNHLVAAGMPKDYFRKILDRERTKNVLSTLRKGNQPRSANSGHVRRSQPAAAHRRPGTT